MSLKAINVTGGSLIEDTGESKTNATVRIGETYYRPIEENETGTTRIVAEVAVMTVADGGSGELVLTNDSSQATVYSGTNYYRPATDEGKRRYNNNQIQHCKGTL